MLINGKEGESSVKDDEIACKIACFANPYCLAYTYNWDGKKGCQLHRRMALAAHKQGAMTGFKISEGKSKIM